MSFTVKSNVISSPNYSQISPVNKKLSWENTYRNHIQKINESIAHYIYCLLSLITFIVCYLQKLFAFPDKMELDCREPQSHPNCAQRILDWTVSEGELQCFYTSLLGTQHPVLRKNTLSLRRASLLMLKRLLKTCAFQHSYQELLCEYFWTVKLL